MIRATGMVVVAGALIGWQRCLVGRSVRLLDGMNGAGALACGPVALARTIELVAGLWIAYASLLWLGLRAAKRRMSWERTLAITGGGMAAVTLGAALLMIGTKLEVTPGLAVGAFWTGVLAWPLATGRVLGRVSGTTPRTITLVTLLGALLIFAPLLVAIARRPPW